MKKLTKEVVTKVLWHEIYDDKVITIGNVHMLARTFDKEDRNNITSVITEYMADASTETNKVYSFIHISDNMYAYITLTRKGKSILHGFDAEDLANYVNSHDKEAIEQWYKIEAEIIAEEAAASESDKEVEKEEIINSFKRLTERAKAAGVDLPIGGLSEETRDKVLKAAELANGLFNHALGKFNWGASALDAKAIDLLNRAPRAIEEALKAVKES